MQEFEVESIDKLFYDGKKIRVLNRGLIASILLLPSELKEIARRIEL